MSSTPKSKIHPAVNGNAPDDLNTLTDADELITGGFSWLDRWFCSDTRQRGAEMVQHKYTHMAVSLVLMVALFLPDSVILGSLPNAQDSSVDVVLLIAFGIFACEFIVNCACVDNYVVDAHHRYVPTFFFTMDLIGTLSVLLDVSFIASSLGLATTGHYSVIRASRAARIGSRAGRLVRLFRIVRVVRIFRFMQKRDSAEDDDDDDVEDLQSGDVPSKVGMKLSERISKWVAALVMLCVLVLPWLQYVESDDSVRAWITLFGRQAARATSSAEYEAGMSSLADEMKNFYLDTARQETSGMVPDCVSSYPYSADITSAKYGNFRIDSWRAGANASYTMREANTTVEDTIQGTDISLTFNTICRVRAEAAFSLMIIAVVIILLLLFGTLFNESCTRIVVRPMERIFETIQGSAAQILTSLNDIGDNDDETTELHTVIERMSKLVKHVGRGGHGHSSMEEAMEGTDIETKAWLKSQFTSNHHGSSPDTSGKDPKGLIGRLGQMLGRDKDSNDEGNDKFISGVDMELLDSWNFDTIKFKDRKEELSCYVFAMYQNLNLLKQFDINPTVLKAFIRECSKHYYDNKYHNFSHAVDVAHTVYRFLMATKANSQLDLADQLALLTAALGHDMEHQGRSNAFLVATKADLAMTYNDNSVMENRHCAVLFEILQKPETNIFENIDEPTWRHVRKCVLTSVLATDMAQHFSLISQLEVFMELREKDILNPLESSEVFRKSETDRMLLLRTLLHCADISNPAKPWSLCNSWANAVMSEFYEQGDDERERGLPISPFMDKKTTSKNTVQVNFIEYIVAPMFRIYLKFYPEATELKDHLIENRTLWGDALIEEIEADPERSADAKKEEITKLRDRLTTFRRQMQEAIEWHSQKKLASEQERQRSSRSRSSSIMGSGGRSRRLSRRSIGSTSGSDFGSLADHKSIEE